MKDKRLWILLAGIVLISLAFLLLDFRVALSNTQTDKLTLTTDMGNNMPVSMQRKDKISVAMVGEGLLVDTLQKALKEKMNKDGMWEIELVQELEPVDQNPVLVVKVGRPSPIW